MQVGQSFGIDSDGAIVTNKADIGCAKITDNNIVVGNKRSQMLFIVQRFFVSRTVCQDK